MSLEFAGKIQQIRQSFDLSRQELADLLDITSETIRRWETQYNTTPCWERIVQFILDCPSSALTFLREKPWLYKQATWPEQIVSLLRRLDWSPERLAEFLSIGRDNIYKWAQGDSVVESCNRISVSLLEIYADVNPKEWPTALYQAEKDIITPERIKLIRQSLSMIQANFANLLRVHRTNISIWEKGKGNPGWCANLLLRVLETYPKAVGLLDLIPWGDQRILPERAVSIRSNLGLTQLEMARLLGADISSIQRYEIQGDAGTDCTALVYELLDQYPEEFLSYIQGLSSPGGQACPIW